MIVIPLPVMPDHRLLIIAIALSCIIFPLSVSGSTLMRDADKIAPPLKDSFHSKEHFLIKYGKDDSSRALIEFFFRKARESKKNTFWWGGTTIASGILLTVLLNIPGESALGALFIFLVIGSLFYGSIIWFAIGIFKWLAVFNKKRLARLLKKYNDGKGIPGSIKRNKTFRLELDVQTHAPRN